MIFQLVIPQNVAGLLGLAGLLVGLLGIGTLFGLSIGRRDGLILGLTGWPGVALLSIFIALVGMLSSVLAVAVAGGLIGLGMRYASDPLLDDAVDFGSEIRTKDFPNLILVGLLGVALLVISQLGRGQQGLVWLFETSTLQMSGGSGGAISWLAIGVGNHK